MKIRQPFAKQPDPRFGGGSSWVFIFRDSMWILRSASINSSESARNNVAEYPRSKQFGRARTFASRVDQRLERCFSYRRNLILLRSARTVAISVQIVHFCQSNPNDDVFAAHDPGVVTTWHVCDNRRLSWIRRGMAASSAAVGTAGGLVTQGP